MPRRFILALIAGCAALTMWSVSPWAGTSKADYIGSYTWRLDDPAFGGFSGLELTTDGRAFTAITDRGAITAGVLIRDSLGKVTGVENANLLPIMNLNNEAVRGLDADPEGLAIDRSGRIYISFEGHHRIWAYAEPGAIAEAIPQHDHFAGLQRNSGMEALAVDAQGRIYTLPERSGRMDRPFPVYRYDGQWSQPFTLPRDGGYMPVGADFGPDGRLYLLERDFRGVFGFFTRISRFEINESSAGSREILLETAQPFQNNFEGLAVWQDTEGALRMMLLSDDNFLGFLTTEFVEYRLVTD